MAAAPSYATTPRVGSVLVNQGTADAAYSTAPSHGSTLLSAGSGGTKVTQIDVTPAATIGSLVTVTVWLFDGTNYRLHEAPTFTTVTLGAATPGTKVSYNYENLVLPSGWSLYVTETVANQAFQVTAFGADL